MWTPLLVLLVLSVLSAVVAGGEEQAASGLPGSPGHPGDLPRDGCVMQVADVDARGIAQVLADCRWPVAPERVVEIVRDNDDIDDVLSTVSDSRVLADGRVVQVHSISRLAAERQVTLHFRSSQLEDGGVRIDFETAGEQYRLGEGRVQIPLDEGCGRSGPTASAERGFATRCATTPEETSSPGSCAVSRRPASAARCRRSASRPSLRSLSQRDQQGQRDL